jgi:hypothetical protein
MTERRLRRALEDLHLPSAETEERGWQMVRAAFAEREPVPRRIPVRPVLALALLGVLVAAVASPPGRAVLGSVREAIGVERAQPSLFALPAKGRLLVTSPAGAWVVADDGAKRLLGRYAEASWSPFGRFVIAARQHELVALEPDGTVRWQLARRNVRFPRWGGTRADTRIAYLTGSRLHVVAGDGTGDVDAGGLPAAAAVAPAWQPGARHIVAYVTTRGRVYLYAADGGAVVWRSAPFAGARQLTWSADGRRLILVTRDRLILFAAGRPEPLSVTTLPGMLGAAFDPAGRRVAVVRARDVLLLDADRLPLRGRPERIFAGAGRLAGVAWAPDGRWLLVTWPDADQWVFMRSSGPHRLDAVSNVAEQFQGPASLAGWCCAPD